MDDWILDAQQRQEEGDKTGSISLKARMNQRFDPVRKSYEAFLKRHPRHAGARLAYGSFLSDLGEEDAAAEQFQKAVEADPKNPAAWNNLANYYGHNGPVEKAFECYGKALALKPLEPVYYQNLATTLYSFRRDATNYLKISLDEVFEKSRALYRRALELERNQAATALLESQMRMAARAHQARGQFAQVGLVTYHQDSPAARLLGEKRQQGLGGASRPKSVAVVSRHAPAQSVGDDLRRFGGADQRARDDPIRVKACAHQTHRNLLHPFPAIGGERPLGVVRVARRAAVDSDAVAHDVKLVACGSSWPVVGRVSGCHGVPCRDVPAERLP